MNDKIHPSIYIYIYTKCSFWFITQWALSSHFLTSVNRAAVNVNIHLSLQWTDFISLGYTSHSGIRFFCVCFFFFHSTNKKRQKTRFSPMLIHSAGACHCQARAGARFLKLYTSLSYDSEGPSPFTHHVTSLQCLHGKEAGISNENQEPWPGSASESS